jgi:hypothetical protein
MATEQHESNHKHENIKHQKGTPLKLTLHALTNVTTKTTAASTMHKMYSLKMDKFIRNM